MIEITTDQMEELSNISYDLLQTMNEIYGVDTAFAMFLKFEEVLGTEVKNHIFLKMLGSDGNNNRDITFSLPTPCLGYIPIIKTLRKLAVDSFGHSLGLREAKDITDNALSGMGKATPHNREGRIALISAIKAIGGSILNGK